MIDKSKKIDKLENNCSVCSHDTLCGKLGAIFLSDNSVQFNLFTFLDVKQVQLELRCETKKSKFFDMLNLGDGLWQLILSSSEAKNGDRYRFVITNCSGETITVKDPCSMHQDSYFKWSRLYNHNLFNWTDYNWQNNLDRRKISRKVVEDNSLSSINSLLIYELHVGTFTNEGTFKSAKDKLSYVKDELGFNAIEIMPVENTYSFNWGYDGVDKYCPNHTYGTPDDLKDLINYAHSIGLNVIMDIVPNHLGPDIAQLHKTGPYIEGDNCFGYKFNFEKEHSAIVRDYITGTAVNWIVNYHCDGLRVDMTKFMCSDYTMKQMAAEVQFYSPDAFLIAEDGRDNDSRVTKSFTLLEEEQNKSKHCEFINQIRKGTVSLSNLGFDTEWDFPFHKQIASSILGSWDCRLKNLTNFDSSLEQAQTRVKYVMSHDEIGNIDGTRLITKIMVNELNLNSKICHCSPEQKYKRIAHAAHNITVALVTGKLEEICEKQRSRFYLDNYLSEYLTFQEIFLAYLNALKLHKLAFAKVYSIPGPKMVFQGDEDANLAYFKFFRKFSTGPEPYLLDKGYEPGLAAFLDSKIDSIKVHPKYEKYSQGVKLLVSDLNKLTDDNLALSVGVIVGSNVIKEDDIHAIHTKYENNEIFAVSNFSKVSYKNYSKIIFPDGKWQEILNTDDFKYMGSTNYLNNGRILSKENNILSLPAYGVVYFKKID